MIDTNTKLNALLFGNPRIKIVNKIPDVDKAFDEFEEAISADWSDILADEETRKRIKIFIANACTFIIDHWDELEFEEAHDETDIERHGDDVAGEHEQLD